MPQVLPFENIPEQAPNDDHSRGAVVQCPLHNILPAPLLERAEASPHLMSYLHKVPLADFGVPEYHPEVSRKMGDIQEPNLIYPVGNDTYIHVFPDSGGARNYCAGGSARLVTAWPASRSLRSLARTFSLSGEAMVASPSAMRAFCSGVCATLASRS